MGADAGRATRDDDSALIRHPIVSCTKHDSFPIFIEATQSTNKRQQTGGE
jgi:hypothetical protein